MTYRGKTREKNEGSPPFLFPRQFFLYAPVSERLEQATLDVTNAVTFMYIETKCSQRDLQITTSQPCIATRAVALQRKI